MKKDKVQQLILDRKNGVLDNRKLGLIIQGGGLRGAFAGGTMIGLEELGLSDVFDCIYGVSAGSCCGAYLLAHQAKLGASIFYEDLDGYKFIQPWKPLKKMNLDYLCDKVMRKKKKLNIERINKAKTDLKVILTEAKTGKYTYFSKNEGHFDLIRVIKASCAYPGYYYPQVKINGKKYLDGNAVKSFPVREAIKDGCTDLMIVTTVPEDYQERLHKKVFFLATRLLTLPLSKRTRREYFDRIKHYNNEIRRIFDYRESFADVNIHIISPEYSVRNVEHDASALRKFVIHGEDVMKRAFE